MVIGRRLRTSGGESIQPGIEYYRHTPIYWQQVPLIREELHTVLSEKYRLPKLVGYLKKYKGSDGFILVATYRIIAFCRNQLKSLRTDRKSTRLNSSHVKSSYAVL